MIKQTPRATYDRFAAHYDCAMRPLEKLLFAQLRARVFEWLPMEARTLEIGCGTGANFKFYDAHAHGAASEISGAMLEKADVRSRPSHVHLAQSAAEDLPFDDDVFDAAFATLVMCSVRSPERVFKELHRVVRPRGRVVLLEHVRPESRILGRCFDALNLLTVSLFEDYFNRRTAHIAQASGLQIERVENYARGIVQIIVCRV